MQLSGTWGMYQHFLPAVNTVVGMASSILAALDRLPSIQTYVAQWPMGHVSTFSPYGQYSSEDEPPGAGVKPW